MTLNHPGASPVPAFAGAARSNQAAAAAPTPLSYHSAFDSYQRYQDDKPTAWKQANDTVHQRGGWRAYAKESEGPAHDGHGATPQPDPHAGHGMHPPAAAPAKKEQP